MTQIARLLYRFYDRQGEREGRERRESPPPLFLSFLPYGPSLPSPRSLVEESKTHIRGPFLYLQLISWLVEEDYRAGMKSEPY